ncbi:MAG: hypothetical protein WBM81_02645 [Sedimenticolaceae bacterium]
MKTSFRDAIEALVNERIAEGADPQELFEELKREANIVFGHYNLDYVPPRTMSRCADSGGPSAGCLSRSGT